MTQRPSSPEPARNPAPPDDRHDFLELSARLTGFSRAELQGTGMVDLYWKLLLSIGGEHLVGHLLRQLHQHGDDDGIAQVMLLDPDTGPLAKNLIALWYLGLWNQMPVDWRDRNGANALDTTHYPSPEAYTQGLVWSTFHTHPQGARQPGYGSWALKPQEIGHE